MSDQSKIYLFVFYSKLNTRRVLRHIIKLTTGATVATAAASKCLHHNTNSCRLIGRQSTCSRHKPITYREVYFREAGLRPTLEQTGEIICRVSHHSCKNGSSQILEKTYVYVLYLTCIHNLIKEFNIIGE